MATISRSLPRSLLQVSRVAAPTKRKCILGPIPSRKTPRRHLSISTSWKADGPRRGSRQSGFLSEIPREAQNAEPPHVDPSNYLTPSKPITADDLPPEERAQYETLSQADRENYLGLQNHYIAVFEQPEDDEALEEAIDRLDREIEKESPFEFESKVSLRPGELGFWAEDEPDEMGVVEDGDDEYDESMITAVAENELELHREIRQYTRVAAWDMPLLSSMNSDPWK